MFHIETFYFNPYRECTYIVSNEADNCFMVDPGMYNEREEERIRKYLDEKGLQLCAVLITHSHPDHVCGLEFIRLAYPTIPVYGASFTALDKAAGEVFATHGFERPVAITTPGHKEDSLCYYFEQEQLLFTGDTLFQESVGRTDLEGGDMEQLLQSLQRLMRLPEQTRVYPGHAYPTTIAHEKQYNPYL